MKNVFSTEHLHTVTEANVNFYNAPFVHPKRKMKEHDFIYLLSGEWVLGQNGQIYELKKDTLLILFAGNTHYGVTPCRPETKTMYFHVRSEEGDIFEQGDGAVGVDTYIDASDHPHIRRLFADVVHAKLSEEQRKADLCLELLLCELSAPKMPLKETEIALKIRNLIHSYPERFFTNEEFAQKMHVSVKTAETKFKAAFGKTIHQYMLDFKIKEATTYFDRFREIKVKEVSCNLGFCDEYHFSRQFVRRMGMTPTQYRSEKTAKGG